MKHLGPPTMGARLMDIDSPYSLSAAQLAAFRADGFIHLRELLSPAILSDYGDRITRLTIALNTETRPLEARSTYDRAFLQVMNLWQHDAAVRQFALGKRLARLAAGLLEVSGVRLYHDQSLYKEPGGGITPAHADQYYWPLASDRTITAWIPLQAVPLEMGPLAFYRGSHRVEFGRDLPISDDSERLISARLQAHGFELIEQPFALGDVSFHLGWTFHRAGANTSDKPRSVMTMIYMDEHMRLSAPTSAMQHNDWQQWCPGARPGEIIATEKNPVCFSHGQGE